LTYCLIDRRHGKPAVARFFCRAFRGTLVSDFWGPYNAVVCSARQVCLAHLLHDLEHVERYKSPSSQWPKFAKRLRRVVRDGIRLSRCEDRRLPEHASRRDCLRARLEELMGTPREDQQAMRLPKRFRRHRNHLFTFLDNAAVRITGPGRPDHDVNSVVA
jgi:transposase